MSGFDPNKTYTVTVHYPNGKIFRDSYGEFTYLSLWNIRRNKNGVYIGYDEYNRERRFNARLTIDYFEF